MALTAPAACTSALGIYEGTPGPDLPDTVRSRDRLARVVTQLALPSDSAFGFALIIPIIIQTVLLCPSGAVWTGGSSNVSRLDPSGTVRSDAEHPACNRMIVPHVLCVGVSHALAGFRPSALG